MSSTSSLLEPHTESVRTEWIDYNEHMNVAYYVLAFDHATDAFLDYLGMDEHYRDERRCSLFTAEAHVTYDREVRLGDPLRFTAQLLDWDATVRIDQGFPGSTGCTTRRRATRRRRRPG